jgi:hypothetical protein
MITKLKNELKNTFIKDQCLNIIHIKQHEFYTRQLQSQITQIHNQKLNALLNPNSHEST